MKKLYFFLLVISFVPALVLANGDMSLVTPWSKGQPVRLAERSVVVNCENGLALMEVEDIFQSLSQSQCEGLYKFTLPAGAFVSGFWINTDGKEWVKGEVREITQARHIYKTITSRMVDPGLLEQKDDELVIRVFPVARNARVGVRFRCYFPAAGIKERFEFSIPVGFGSAAEMPGRGANDDVRVNFKFAASIKDSSGIEDFLCSINGGEVNLRDREADVSFSGELPALADFSMSFRPAQSQKAVLGYYQIPTGGKFSLLRISAIESEEAVSELNLALIIDGSGSMANRNRQRVIALSRELSSKAGIKLSLFVCNEKKLGQITEIESYNFSGANNWENLGTFPNQDYDAAILLSDGDDLRQRHLQLIKRGISGKPLGIVLTGQNEISEIRAFGENFAGVIAFAGMPDTAGEVAARALKSISANPCLYGPGNKPILPLYGKLEQTAYYVLPFKPGKYLVKSRSGKLLLDLELPQDADFAAIQPWFVSIAARQQIKTLEMMEQSEAVVKKITELGIKYSQATDYTAFLAVPEAIARENADVMNPAYLAMFAAPNFRKAREQARNKACYANQRVLLGAIEMYLMDHTDSSGLEHELETGKINIEALIKEKYLKSELSKPTNECDYRILGDIAGESEIFCVVHGSVEGQGQITIQEMVEEYCRKHKLDPEDFDIPYDLFGSGDSGADLWSILRRYETLRLLLILLF